MNSSEPATLIKAVSAPSPSSDGVLANWWDGMLWHRVLRSPVLGLRPGRLGLSFFLVVLLWLLLEVGRAVDETLVPAGALMPWNDPARPDLFALSIWHIFVALPGALVRGWPVTTLIMAPLMIVLGAVVLGAVSRMTAEEFARGRHMSWQAGLLHSARLWRSTVGAYVGPLVLIWLLALKFAVLGWVFLNWPILNILGSLFYGVFLLGSLIAVIVAVAYLLGEAMLIPAVVCEGADAIDAVQRAYAYVLARPLRLILYLLLGLLGLLAIVAVLAAIAAWTIGFAAQATGAWVRPPAWSMLWWGSFGEPPPPATVDGVVAAEPPAGVFAIGTAFIQIWVVVPILLVLASFFSGGMAAATVIYLAMRRICDGQDVGELWTPGAVEAAMGQIMDSRREAVKAYHRPDNDPPAPAQEPPGKRDE